MEHHILTVGVSLLQNFARSRTPPLDLAAALKHHHEVREFLRRDPRAASAEINSLHLRTGFLDPECRKELGVTLVYTHTKEGKCACSLLEKFLKNRGVHVDKIPVKGFDNPTRDFHPAVAQREALEALSQMRDRLIRHIARLRNRSRKAEIQINVTGGYKAEVAVLYELGRALRLPVYYLHESFRTCVTLP